MDSTTTHPSPHPAAVERPSPLTLPVVLGGVVLAAMSISGTAVALPSMGRDLDPSGSALNWVVAGYNLAFAAMTLVAGSAADRVGRRRVFILAALVFAAGFLATALSPAVLLTDVARIVSGAGCAGIMAAGGGILASSYHGAARNRAFALMGTMAGIGIAVGPTLSGVLITATGWRGSFAIFTVIGLLVALGATRARESRASGAGPIDWAGSVLFITALTLLMFTLLEAPALGWTHPVILVTGLAGLITLMSFGVVQRRGAAPVLAPSLVANRGFLGWSLATLTTSIGFLGVLVFLPTYLQAAGLSPAAAGAAMLLLTAPVLVMPLVAVTLVNKGISARLLIMVALALVVAGNLWLTALNADHAISAVAAPLVMIGVGMGASFGITDGQAMALVPADAVGMAAGFLNTLRGAAEALVIAAFSASLIGLLAARLGDPDRAAAVSAGRLTPGAQATADLDAFTWSWHLTQLGVALLCLMLSIAVAALIHRGAASSRHPA
ncbi:MFS transporter [Sphaerisporangium siamense]|uniref:MFS family permease n=1 Tax=Sphaerisporangium siamense TaxID=795645 RepID=A0A7W7D4C2_9ACTN|nr:MFS transporter [Sphaerisporangium siamense]MBB4699957.1 MFS family permease [Sphaerisporangium siamense]GII84724.1 MFS transporter [Sphaerisporangium siamense]